MALRRLASRFCARKETVAVCNVRKSNFRRAILPTNTYYRFKRKGKELRGFQPQNFRYFLVLDFEATCDDTYFPEMEVIEFPCLKVDSRTFQVIDQFHSYVRPVKHPTLSEFCINLTGICQTTVDNKLPFQEVLGLFLEWVKKSDIELEGPECNSIFVTCGDWDLLTMLPKQCELSAIPIPSSMMSWINIKKSFLQSTGTYPHGIKDMLSLLKLQHEGRLHSGIDDCRNILKILRGIAERGFVFEMTRSLKNAN